MSIMGMEYKELDLIVTNENIISDAKNLLNILRPHWNVDEIIIKVRVQENIFDCSLIHFSAAIN